MAETLSEQHQKFLDAFFEHRGSVAKAAEAAGYSNVYGYILVKTLRKEIIERAEHILAAHAPQAAFALAGAIDGTSSRPASPVEIAAAKEILDRVGIVKKDQLTVNAGENLAIFILPAKDGPSNQTP